MGYDLTLEQQQKLVMTPELKLALKILQMPAIELDELVEQEIEVNPVLDFEEEYSEDKNDNETKNDLQEKDKEVDWKEYLQYQGKSYCLEGTSNDDSNELAYDNLAAHSYTLRDHMLLQLHLSMLKGKYYEIAEYIIESLDENGYLTVSVEDLSAILKTGQSEIEKILNIVQTFDPAGVASRNLKECLLIQLNGKCLINDTLKNIVEEHLDDIANNKISNIAKRFSISIEDAQKFSDIIKSLEPKPGRSFEGTSSTKYVVPDAYIEKINDEYIITVNDKYGSRLMINQYYKSILNHEERASKASQYINDKLSSAIWLIRSLEHRKNTLYKVIEAIVEYQKDFFDKGIMHMKTMTLKTIADKIEMHESTVSRAINGKYVQTPRGTFEIKYFFKSGVDNDFGSSVSSESIKKMIKSIIEKEDALRPISDQEMADDLIKSGMKISRRTVAKYRDELGIPSSSKRKRF